MELEAIEKIRKARILIQSENPFFAYLSLYLKFREARKGDLPEHAGMGVNSRGDVVYKKEFVDGLSDIELRGVIVHEILHLSFLHLLRLGNRHPLVWNVSCDIVVNHILKENGFILPDGCLIADWNKSITVFGQEIKKIDTKTPEQIYDEFKIQPGRGGWGPGKDGGFDYHDYGPGDGKDLTEEEKRGLEKEWKERLSDAYVTAQQAGKTPLGIERLIGKLHKNEINWKTVLLREVQNQLPSDYTYARPFKSSFSTGYYMPDVTKEVIDIVVGVDVSGSVDKKTYTAFVSEVVGMAQAFRNKINIRFLTHDVDVKNDYTVSNGNVDKIRRLKVDGGGGTSHEPIFNYIRDKIKGAKMAIFLTDGYSDLDDFDIGKYNYKKIFVIQENGSDRQIDKSKAKILHLKGIK